MQQIRAVTTGAAKPLYNHGFSFCLERIVMSTLPPCPKCASEYTYEDGVQLVCPECGHEWSADAPTDAGDADKVYKDSVGKMLLQRL